MEQTQFAPPQLSGQAPVAPDKKASGLFGSKPKVGLNLDAAVADMAGEVNNIARRLRILEERYTNLRKKTQVTDQNMLASHKRVMTEVTATLQSIAELKTQFVDFDEKFKILVREVRECAKKQDVQVLQKYISFWEPLNFVTRESVSKMVEETVQSQFRDLNIRLAQEQYIKEQVQFAIRELKRGNS